MVILQPNFTLECMRDETHVHPREELARDKLKRLEPRQFRQLGMTQTTMSRTFALLEEVVNEDLMEHMMSANQMGEMK